MVRRSRLLVILSLPIPLLGFSSICRAAWPSDPAINLPVAVAPAVQNWAHSADDGRGGVFLIWQDGRDSSTTGVDIYAQHVDAQGMPLWHSNGVPVERMPNDQYLGGSGAVLAPDNAGGLFVAFGPAQNVFRVRLQHLDTHGTPQWGDSGIACAASDNVEINPRLLSDGSGGVFACWSGYTDSIQAVWSQHFNARSEPLWTPNGVVVCASVVPQSQEIVSDGSGGVILSWQDYRPLSSGDIYAQRLNASGTPQWAQNGAPVCTAPGYQELLAMAGDGLGGTLITWSDRRTSQSAVYVQRMSGAGSPAWANDGVQVCLAQSYQYSSEIVPDGAGGGIVAWVDERGSTGQDIYSQHVRADGSRAWSDNGVRVTAAPGSQIYLGLVSDGQGGAIATWRDSRSGTGTDIYAQRIGADGVARWTTDGIPVGDAPGNQEFPTIVPDAAGGAIIAWEDERADAGDIYTQNVNSDGTLGGTIVAVTVSLVSAEVIDGHAVLDWYAANAANLSATVERRTENSAWVILSAVASDGSGHLRYLDWGLTPGTRYAYRLSYTNGGALDFTPEIWVDVPALVFTLGGVRPNPAVRVMNVWFSLPNGSPATLAIVDVAGRTVMTRDVGSLGAGRHTVSLDLGAGSTPGMHWVRLTQAGRALVVKAILIR